jgi:formylglycine-generating enzyme required for sulfatase activity
MLRTRSFRLWLLLPSAFLLFHLLPPAASAVNIDWVTVGGAGNPCETQSQGCFGAVANAYRIAETEVTNAQYAEFLNAVGATDSNALYHLGMGFGFAGGITRSGNPGSYAYSTIAGRANMPVNYVSFYDSLRFANWLQNGQLTGAQDATTTENGAYDMSLGSNVTRNAGATIFLTSEDEWYKAAYYDAVSASYFEFPAGSNAQTGCAVPGATANTANCNNAVGNLTDVKSYPNSASPNGTFDQGGNVWEWNESISGANRGLRGGAFLNDPPSLGASVKSVLDPAGGNFFVGFRVASVPEPGTGLLVMMGLLGLACRQKRRA